MSESVPPPGAASETVASPPPTNTRPLPTLLLLDALLLDALLLDSPLLDALPLVEALLLVTPVDAVLLVASPPAPLDELLVGSVPEPQATSHAPASATKAPSDATRIADRRRLRSRWTMGLFINAFPADPAGTRRSAVSIDLTCRSTRKRIHALSGANPFIVPGTRREHHRCFHQDVAGDQASSREADDPGQVSSRKDTASAG